MDDQTVKNLCAAFQVLRSEEEVREFLMDLLTPREMEKLAIRFEIMRLSLLGLPRNEIQAHLRDDRGTPSLTTISRANTVLAYGTGMASTVLKRLEQE